MKRHLRTSTVTIDKQRSTGPPVDSVKTIARLAEQAVSAGEGSLVLRSVSPWTHTLVLTGELTHRSAHALEVEIERLCEEGVTGITLDLRELTYIDSTGVAVIAFRSGLCEKRGYEFTMIPGSLTVQRAFERAGVADLLPFRAQESAEDGQELLTAGVGSGSGEAASGGDRLERESRDVMTR
jgi:anti-anti-sigma factor